MTWKNEHSLEIVSEPEVQVSYAKSLVTRAELAVTGSSQGVSIDVKVVVGGWVGGAPAAATDGCDGGD